MANLHPDSSGFKKPNTSYTNLTLRQKKAVKEYLRTGNKSAAIRAVYKVNPKHVSIQANTFFKKPKIIDALSKALKDEKFNDSYAVKTLKKIVDGGMENIDITRPDTALKALETYFKITNKMGGGNKVAIKVDLESQAKKMDVLQLRDALKEMDKKQKRILDVLKGVRPELQEGEILE
jgi:phage terminase small subunit